MASRLRTPRSRWYRIAIAVLLFGLLGALPVGAAPPANGKVYAWGQDISGQLGDGTTGTPNATATPQAVTGLSNVVALAASVSHSLALRNDGTVWAWGDDVLGQLGDGTVASPSTAPTPQQVPGLSGVANIAAGGAGHSLALKSDGTVWAWGWDYYAQLGDGTAGTPTSVPTPQQVVGLAQVVAIASGTFHNLALQADGTVWAWGNDDFGQLGDGTVGTPSTVATAQPVSGLSGVIAIASGTYHSVAMKADGSVYAWGWDAWGQLGDGTTGSPDTVAVPQPVAGLSGVIAVSANAYASLALKTDGTVSAWGLGSMPTAQQVAGLGNVIAIASGGFHNLALKDDQTVWAWGDNGNGQVGVGVPNSPSAVTSPQNVATVSGVATIAAGAVHSLALGGAVPNGALPKATTLVAANATGTYGGTATLSATLTRTSNSNAIYNELVRFTINGAFVGQARTDATGVAQLNNVSSAGINAGTYPTAIGASHLATTVYGASADTARLTVTRRILWLKASDRTVGLQQPNPAQTPPAGCVAQQTATSACWLEVANNTTFAAGDDWADLNLTNLRFTYSRNYPSSNAAETVGKIYKISATGILSTNYDVRYQQGTLTVVAP